MVGAAANRCSVSAGIKIRNILQTQAINARKEKSCPTCGTDIGQANIGRGANAKGIAGGKRLRISSKGYISAITGDAKSRSGGTFRNIEIEIYIWRGDDIETGLGQHRAYSSGRAVSSQCYIRGWGNNKGMINWIGRSIMIKQ